MPDAGQREPAGGLPLAGLGELLVAEHHAGLLVRRVRVRPRQRHRHVQVVGAGGERSVEDRHHEPRVDRVEHVGDAVLAAQRRDGVGRGRVDLGRDEPRVVGVPLEGSLGPAYVVVGDHHASRRSRVGRRCRPQPTPRRRHRPAGSACVCSSSVRDGRPAAGAAGRSRCRRRRAAMPDSASSTTRLASAAVMSAWSYGGETSTTSTPTTGSSRQTRRTASSSCARGQAAGLGSAGARRVPGVGDVDVDRQEHAVAVVDRDRERLVQAGRPGRARRSRSSRTTASPARPSSPASPGPGQ